MSLDSARSFVTKVLAHDEAALMLLPAGISPEIVGAEEITTITETAKTAGWDFTADELQEAYLNSLSLNESDLSAVAGGDPQYDGPIDDINRCSCTE